MVRGRLDTAERQELIVDAARKLLIKYGSEHVTVRRIARQVGISEAAIYRHFRSKRDMPFVLINHVKNDLLAGLSTVNTRERTLLEALDSGLKCHLSAVKPRLGTTFQVVAEIASLGDRKLFETINKYIGCLDSFDSQQESESLWGVLRGGTAKRRTWAPSGVAGQC
jgi:AcrR family transcriptional regulator